MKYQETIAPTSTAVEYAQGPVMPAGASDGDAGHGGPVAEPLLATASQVAEMLQISPRTLWRLVSGRKVPQPLRIGGAVRWRLEEIKAWIAAGCPSPVNEKQPNRK